MSRLRIGSHQRFYAFDITIPRCIYQRRVAAGGLIPCAPDADARIDELVQLVHILLVDRHVQPVGGACVFGLGDGFLRLRAALRRILLLLLPLPVPGLALKSDRTSYGERIPTGVASRQ